MQNIMIFKEAGRHDNFKSMLAGTPEGKLLLSVLIQTLQDATKVPSQKDRKHMVREQAVEFLLNDSDMLTLCLWLANIGVDEMRDIFWQKGFSKDSYKLIYHYLVSRRPDQNIPVEDDDENDMDL